MAHGDRVAHLRNRGREHSPLSTATGNPPRPGTPQREVREAGGVRTPSSDTPAPAPHLGPLVVVDDPDDPRLELYRNLNDPVGRVRVDAMESVFVVEGKLAVERLLTSEYSVRSLLVDDHQATAANDLVTATRALGVPVFVGSRRVVAGTVGFELHRGVVAVANRPSPMGTAQLLAEVATATAGEPPVLLAVLEGLNDHENIGALFRNVAAFGVAGVLLSPTCADPLYRRSIRVSVGHVLHTRFARLAPWPSGLHQLRDAGFVLAALVPHPAASSGMRTVSLSELKARMSGSYRPLPVAVLLGAEGAGLTDAAVAASDVVVSIPMANGVDSLNVATAGAVAFHSLAHA
jgi:tRNA G18 (ribose-2'-O)-methylase SpoU